MLCFPRNFIIKPSCLSMSFVQLLFLNFEHCSSYFEQVQSAVFRPHNMSGAVKHQTAPPVHLPIVLFRSDFHAIPFVSAMGAGQFAGPRRVPGKEIRFQRRFKPSSALRANVSGIFHIHSCHENTCQKDKRQTDRKGEPVARHDPE